MLSLSGKLDMVKTFYLDLHNFQLVSIVEKNRIKRSELDNIRYVAHTHCDIFEIFNRRIDDVHDECEHLTHIEDNDRDVSLLAKISSYLIYHSRQYDCICHYCRGRLCDRYCGIILVV